MKKTLLFLAFILPLIGHSQESYGKTANLGLGLGYGWYRSSLPIIHFNYEFNAAKNLTLAPFVTLIHYGYTQKWNGKKYKYRSTTIPIGVKASYYFDEIFSLDPKFDIYLGAMIGFNLYSARWDDDDYNGPDYDRRTSSLYWDLNFGVEYHINERIGLLLDLSTGISTFGIAIHQ